jgi:UDP-N-acetylmuramoyl-tripeptide--D-alanyl-D-alanine ligase
MFQLNGYKNKTHSKWLLNNFTKQRIVVLPFILAIFLGIWHHSVPAALLIAAVLLVLLYYVFLRRLKAKKKLIFTSRVKRLIVTNSLLFLVLFSLGLFLGNDTLKYLIPGIVCIAEPWLVILSNYINMPIEKLINHYYINDAKKILKGIPKLQVIGITGSYGKTSVKYYLSSLLQTKYNVLFTPESYNTPMGIVKTIRSSLKPTHEIFVCEMGAKNIGDIKEICDIVHPRHGIITSIGPQHLETFKSIENVIKTKFELADALPGDGLLFLNGDNEYIAGLNGKYRSINYSISRNDCNYHVKNMRVSQLGTEFTVISPDGEETDFQTKLVGAHNVVNVVGALAAANTLGIALEDLTVPVRRLHPVAHRLQLIEKGNTTLLDDAYNSNPVGSKAALETLGLFDGLKIMITPGMIELGTQEEFYNYEFGKSAATQCDYVILVGKKQTKPIEKGLMDAGFAADRLYVTDYFEDALKYAYSIKSDKHKFILLENDLPDNY